MRHFFQRDVLFLHAPAVLDFRRRVPLLAGPVSDVVPSSTAFEMYPVGITSIAERLECAGYHVQVINVAYRMLRDPSYQPEDDIRRHDPRLWAIDLHWLPHAHGALALAELIKRHHPESRVLSGGLSASYYHRELVAHPSIDFVLRGDSTEEPALELVRRLAAGAPLDGVPNLTWKRPDGEIVVNPLSHVPATLDGIEVPAYRYALRSVFKYWNLHNVVPYLRWLEFPMTALLTARGCAEECVTCGGSKSSYRLICGRSRPAVRSPERLLADVRFIRRFSRAPIFVIHDIRMHGAAYVDRLLELLRREAVDNEVIYELFEPAAPSFFHRLREATPCFGLELTLESHDPALRRLNRKFAVDNDVIESTIEQALAAGCQRLDVFFMVGIPRQTRASALASMDYARSLLERFADSGRFQVYVAPLAPFLDPGSAAFEQPAAFGYRRRAETLEDHRRRLELGTWEQVLNFESTALPPADLVETTYEAMARLVESKRDLGLLADAEARRSADLIRDGLAAVRAARAAPGEAPGTGAPAALGGVATTSLASCRIYDQADFVGWGHRGRQFRLRGLAPLLVELFFEELRLMWRRLRTRRGDWPLPTPLLATTPAAFGAPAPVTDHGVASRPT